MKSSREKWIGVKKVLRELGVRTTHIFNRVFDDDAEEEFRIRIVRGPVHLVVDIVSTNKCAQLSGHLDFDRRTVKEM